MFPMVSSVSELNQALTHLEIIKDQLREDNIPFNEKILVGAMIEIPSAALMVGSLLKKLDFVSIGTNDLIQYSMAADRMNEKVSYLYQPYNPSLLRLIKLTIDGGHKEGKWVGMCGEMAGEEMAAPLLLGLGLDEFSMSASSILQSRKMIRSLKYSEMKEMADKALNMSNEAEVVALVKKTLKLD